jgi:arylsulfatase A-like enzyme
MQSKLEEATVTVGSALPRLRGEAAAVGTVDLAKTSVALSAITLVLVACWFGLIAGMVEGVLATLLRGVPGFAIRVSPEILWIATSVNLILFLLFGASLAAMQAIFRKRIGISWQVFLFATPAILCWLLLIGKLHQIAAIALSVGIASQIGRRLRGREEQTLRFLKSSAGAVVLTAMLLGLIGAFWEPGRERYLTSKLTPAPQDAPNVLLISLDTLRADHLSSYGYDRTTDPNLAKLAQGGVLFENTFANASWTLPSHASLFTGRLPHEHGADWTTPLDDKYQTLAESLAKRGYLTGAFAANLSYATPEWGMDRGFIRYQSHGSSLISDATSTVYGKKLALNVLPRLGYFDIPGRKRAEQINEEFTAWLGQSNGRPFFAFLNYFDLHDPYLTSESHQTRFTHTPTRGEVINFQFQANSFRRKPIVTKEEIQTELDSYDGCLAYLDARLGELFAELKRRDLDKNTIVIVTADHGEAFGEHDLFGHGNSLYLATLQVPLIIYAPGRVPAGRRISEAVSLRDIPATVMNLVGGDTNSFPGRSMVKFWSHEGATQSAEAIISELSPGRFKDGPSYYPATQGGLRSLLTDEWHLIVSDSGKSELYAWKRDPREENDLAKTEAGQVVVRELLERLNSQVGRTK